MSWPLNWGHPDSKGVSHRQIVLLLMLHMGSGILDVLVEGCRCLWVGRVRVDFCSYQSVVNSLRLFVLSELAYALILVDLHVIISWHECDNFWLWWRIESIPLRRDSLSALLCCLLLLIVVVFDTSIKEQLSHIMAICLRWFRLLPVLLLIEVLAQETCWSALGSCQVCCSRGASVSLQIEQVLELCVLFFQDLNRVIGFRFIFAVIRDALARDRVICHIWLNHFRHRFLWGNCRCWTTCWVWRTHCDSSQLLPD